MVAPASFTGGDSESSFDLSRISLILPRYQTLYQDLPDVCWRGWQHPHGLLYDEFQVGQTEEINGPILRSQCVQLLSQLVLMDPVVSQEV